jgi:hypothetical protein
MLPLDVAGTIYIDFHVGAGDGSSFAPGLSVKPAKMHRGMVSLVPKLT